MQKNLRKNNKFEWVIENESQVRFRTAKRVEVALYKFTSVSYYEKSWV